MKDNVLESIAGLTEMDEIRDAEKVVKEMYSYILTELQRLRNEEVRHLWKSQYRLYGIPLLIPTNVFFKLHSAS